MITAILLDTQHEWESVENKLASWLSLSKLLIGIPASLPGKQVAGPSSLSEIVTQFNEIPEV